MPVLLILGDNGGSAEGGRTGTWNELYFCEFDLERHFWPH
jgi:hypothetical protein